MKRSKTFLLITILFLFVSSVFAQQTSYEIITYKEEMFGKTIDEKSKIIGSNGKLWMGGTGEVSRLDGDTWTTFPLNEEFSGREIHPRAVSPDGVLWFSGQYPDMKTYRFDGETCITFSLGHEGMTVFPNNIAIGLDGVVWAGGFYGVVFYYKDETWTKTIVDYALGNVIIINDLAVDPDGVVYAATNGGVYMYKDGKWINTYGPERMDEYPLWAHDAYAVTVGPDGKVWVGTNYGEVSWFDGDKWTKIVEFTAIQKKILKVWSSLRTLINHENSYFSKNGEYINFDYGEDCESVQWLARNEENFEVSFQDSIATAREKVDVNGDGDTADGLTFSVTEIEGIIAGSDINWKSMFGEGPSGYSIHYMAFSSYKELWVVGTFSKLGIVLRYDNGTWTQYITTDALEYGYFTSVKITPDGVVWVAAYKSVWQLIPTTTSVEKDDISPSEFAIIGNYPNPFNPTTTIEFTIPETGFINLSIYNITGQKIRELVADSMPAGTHSVVWDGRDENGMMVSSGIYISSLNSGEHVTAGRMLLMK